MAHAMATATATATAECLTDLTDIIHTSEGFPELLQALRDGRSGTIDGAWGSSSALAAAALAAECEQTLLVVLAHPRDVDPWALDLASFSGTQPVVFPAWDRLPTDRDALDDISGQRLRILKQLESGQPPPLMLTTLQALLQPVPDREQLLGNRRVLRAGETADMDELARWLVEHGFRRTEAVELPGEFSRRGGILDVFSPDAENPFRLEFFGDEIESLRQFAADTQRSLGQQISAEITGLRPLTPTPLPPGERGGGEGGEEDGAAPVALTGHLCDYLPAGSRVVLVEVDDLYEQGKHYLERVPDPAGLFSVEGAIRQMLRFPSVTVSGMPTPTVEATCHLRVESVERFSGEVAKVRDELDSIAPADRVLIACHNEAECKRLSEVLAAGRLAQSGRLHLVTGHVRAGFRLLPEVRGQRSEVRSQKSEVRSQKSEVILDGDNSSLTSDLWPLTSGFVVLGGQELFHREDVRQVLPRRRQEARAIDTFLDLAEGDLVVHVSHGIARFRGMHMLEKNGRQEEHLLLEFRERVFVYVPTSKIDLVQKYVGGAKADPELSKYGGVGWARKKERVQAAVLDLATEMIELQAVRAARAGIAYGPDSEWQAEFEAAFPYRETPDQLTTLGEIKSDMERARPTDRLVCGDVGYGKTELAVRAAFKAVDNGRQVAVLVPTTVLAEQHYRTFSQRLAEYPFTVEAISRFRTAGEQRRILERLSRGGIDVVIGTHRIVSADVQFKDLGLVIIDEEQRFGVEHKERLKKLRQTVDVLTLTATPIPRTLHLSLLGVRDISNLETPPPDRLSIETRIVRFDDSLVRHAILRELNREGQVYFVHNRVYDIQSVADRVQSIVPEARLVIAHGQMREGELEEAMLRFVRREADVLVATTIIESGLDIPNANTIFINEADNYGLADLHQLRGRVGRYKHRAYAYLLLDGKRQLSPNAARRLKAIEEFTELGAGFKIALRDLEIRGAGNILGNQQSGHIAAVGYELYCQLLENAVRGLKNQPLKTPLEVNLDLPWKAFLPRDYVPGQRLRIEVYRRLGRVRSLERLEDFGQELRDRFGSPPEPAEWLLRMAEVRILAARWQIASLHLEKPDGEFGPTDVVLGYRNPRRIRKLAEESAGRVRVVDDNRAHVRLAAKETEPLALYECLRRLLASGACQRPGTCPPPGR